MGLDLAHGILALRLGGEKLGNLVESRLDLHLMGSFSILPWLEVGGDVPFTLWQDSGLSLLAERTGIPVPEVASFAAGDARALAKARLLDEKSAPLSVAAIGEVRLPTGDEQSFLGERGPVLGLRGAAERTFGIVRVAGELGYRLRDRPGRALNLYVGDEITFGAGAQVRPWSTPQDWVFSGELVGSTPARAPFGGGDALISPLELLLGAGVRLGEVRLTAGLGRGLTDVTGYGRETLRAFALVSWERTVRDRDGDGIEDSEDACPEVPETVNGVEDCDGCPENDRDLDGVEDDSDRCPDVPGPRDLDGCPDRDRDEIPDLEDACPDERGPASRAGCPEAAGAELKGNRVEFQGAVNFETGRATLFSDALPVLTAIAKVLREHPEIRKLRIEGHTDSVGAAPANLDLSRRRAETVKQYLVDEGIDPGRLVAVGKGESEPVADNDTPLGRAKNRRVVFEVVEAAKTGP